jgi:hypothetical protein
MARLPSVSFTFVSLPPERKVIRRALTRQPHLAALSIDYVASTEPPKNDAAIDINDFTI